MREIPFYLNPGVHRMLWQKPQVLGGVEALLERAIHAPSEQLAALLDEINDTYGNTYGWAVIHAGRTVHGKRFIDVMWLDDDDPEAQPSYSSKFLESPR